MHTDGMGAGPPDPHAVRLRELGELLRKTREDKRISVAEAVEATKVRSRYLQAIEAGDHGILPGKVYARGFVRTYADFLGLGGAELANLYLGVARDEELPRLSQPGVGARSMATPVSTPAAQSRSSAAKRRALRNSARVDSGFGTGLLKVAAVVVLFTLAVVAYAALSHSHRSEESTGAVQRPGQTAGAKAKSHPGGVVGKGTAKVDSTAKSAKTVATGTMGQTKPAGAKTGATSPVLTEVSSRSGAIAFSVAASGPLHVTLSTVGGPCWFEATADGSVLNSYTVKAGQSAQLTAVRTLSILLGNLPVARLQVDGLAVPLGTGTNPTTYTFTEVSK
ncbi:MAG: DUF4115 domain-containing protein [Firmicutes bacterium]|nr:DUF4115 domain-containing protein [Bacillota bacterium]